MPEENRGCKTWQGFVVQRFEILRCVAGARTEFVSHRPRQLELERELQTHLNVPGASRTDDRISGYDVGCAAPAAEP